MTAVEASQRSAAPGFAALEEHRRELTTEEWQAILHKLWDVGVPHVCFTGGEATLRDAYDSRPEMHRATYLVPHGDAAGTAANVALHLAPGAR